MSNRKTTDLYSRLRSLVYFKAIVFILLLTSQSITLATDWSYTVRPGDNLWNLTEKFLIDQSYRSRVRDYNRLEDSDRILPGQIIVVPSQWLKVQPLSATLVQISGDISIKRADGTTDDSPENGATLNATDSVITEADGSGVILFADKSEVLIHPETHITLDAISAFDGTGMIDTSFRLRGGRVENTVNPVRKPKSRFRVITPPAIAAVKGTEFSVAYNIDKNTTLAEVNKGLVGMQAGGKEVEIPAGFGSVTEFGKPPSPPRARLAAPDLSQLPDRIDANNIKFKWVTLDGALSYFTQLYSVEDKALLKTSTSNIASVQFELLPAKQYSLRVVAIDAVGLYGRTASHSFWTMTKSKGPELSQPANKSISTEPAPVFIWKRDSTAQSYRLQVSEEDDFRQLIADVSNHPSTTKQFDTRLTRGHYYWRVASVSNEQIESDWSESYTFTIVGKLAPPVILSTKVSDQTLSVNWKINDEARSYRIELATDNKFENIISSEITSSTRHLFESLPNTAVYIRVQSIGRLDRKGHFSPVLAINAYSGDQSLYLLIIVFITIVALIFIFRRR